MLEKLHQHFPDAAIDFCIRKGNESLLEEHPFINQLLIWDKKKDKLKNLFALGKKIRNKQYHLVVNLHRFASTGFITAMSGAKYKVGFKKNPLSFLYSHAVEYKISAKASPHEEARNLKTIEYFTDDKFFKPKLYPTEAQRTKAVALANGQKFVTISPASVWFTKQLPIPKWIELVTKIPDDTNIFILGGPADVALGEEIIKGALKKNMTSLCGKLGLLASAAFMKLAEMNYVNDSAPLHLCSAVNAPVTAFFVSTVPEFGFSPLSNDATILQTSKNLACRPCGVHGHKVCPEGHFKCSEIEIPIV